jgi:hypothetical protein
MERYPKRLEYLHATAQHGAAYSYYRKEINESATLVSQKEMGGACGTHGRDEKYEVLVRKREGKRQFKSLDTALNVTV